MFAVHAIENTISNNILRDYALHLIVLALEPKMLQRQTTAKNCNVLLSDNYLTIIYYLVII